MLGKLYRDFTCFIFSELLVNLRNFGLEFLRLVREETFLLFLTSDTDLCHELLHVVLLLENKRSQVLV